MELKVFKNKHIIMIDKIDPRVIKEIDFLLEDCPISNWLDKKHPDFQAKPMDLIANDNNSANAILQYLRIYTD